MNHRNSLLILVPTLLLFGCGGGDPNGSSESGSHDHHVHVAPHGGQLVEVGEHGSGFNLELVQHFDGFLQIYILDAHAENFVRIQSESIELTMPAENNTVRRIILEAIPDPVTGETVGNTSLFTSTERVTDLLPLKAVIPRLDILESTFENVEIYFTGSPDTSSK